MSTLLLLTISALILFAMYIISRPTVPSNYVYVKYHVWEEEVADADEWYAQINAQVDAQYATYEEYADIQDSIYDKYHVIDKYSHVIDKHDLKDMRNCTTKRKHSGIHKAGKIDRHACAYAKRLNQIEGLFN